MVNAERQLWNAVILMAFTDAEYDLHDKQKLWDRDKARKYLTTPSKDLFLVCEYAGIMMQSVIDKAKEREADGWKPINMEIEA